MTVQILVRPFDELDFILVIVRLFDRDGLLNLADERMTVFDATVDHPDSHAATCTVAERPLVCERRGEVQAWADSRALTEERLCPRRDDVGHRRRRTVAAKFANSESSRTADARAAGLSVRSSASRAASSSVSSGNCAA